jgi:hypothetical protein
MIKCTTYDMDGLPISIATDPAAAAAAAVTTTTGAVIDKALAIYLCH